MSKSSLRSCEECPKVRWSQQQRGIGHLASGIPDRDDDDVVVAVVVVAVDDNEGGDDDDDDDHDDDHGDRHKRRADGVGKFNPVIL
ncbi:hypothetical protein KCV03_g10387, partial [Aureobasidium melanogenum]